MSIPSTAQLQVATTVKPESGQSRQAMVSIFITNIDSFPEKQNACVTAGVFVCVGKT
jgi:hypothetical protein